MPSTETEIKKTEEQNTIVQHDISLSPAFIEELDPIQLLERLDKCIALLDGNTSQQAMDEIIATLKSYEVIIMNDRGEIRWINEPFKLHHITEKRPMMSRIAHLLKTGGEWKSETIRRHSMEVMTRSAIPLQVPVNKNVDTNDKAIALKVAIIYLHGVILGMLLNNSKTVGVFKKPDGIVAMNKISAWLTSNEKYGSWVMKDELDIMSLYDVVKTATYTRS